jgi:hypothetical protein
LLKEHGLSHQRENAAHTEDPPNIKICFVAGTSVSLLVNPITRGSVCQ